MFLSKSALPLNIYSYIQSFSSRSEITWIHIGVEFLLSFVFYLLTALLIYFLWYRKDIKFRWGYVFAPFLLLGGITHTVRLAAPWYPVYAFETILKFFNAFFAVAAAVILWRLMPHLLKLPHPDVMKETFRKLNDEIERYKQSEKTFFKTQQNLESSFQQKIQESGRMKEMLEHEVRQSEKEIELLPSVLQELNEATDFRSALEVTLRKTCEMMEWDYGEVWVVAENGRTLEYCPAWCGDERFEELRRASHELRFPPGLGLQGHVWTTKKPYLVDNLFSAPNGTFFRVEQCRNLGLQTALGVPILMEGKVRAVMVFLMREIQEQNKRRMALVTAAVELLACVLERKMSEKTLKEAEELQEKRIRERTKELLKAKEGLEAKITQHQQIEESLRRSQENFSTLLNSIDGIIWEFDSRSSKFTFVSEQAERILGYPVEAWFAEPTFWQDHIHGGDRAHAMAFLDRVIQEKKDGRNEYRMITADGRTIWLRDLVTVVVEKNEAIKLRGVMVNITESKQVAEALNQERTFASAIFETASALVMVLDTEGRIVRFNRACEQTSGYSASEAAGRLFWELFSIPQEVEKAKTIFSRLLAGQFPINDENFWATKDGSYRAIAWSNTVLLNKYGAVIHIIATGVDITKRKEVEQKLKVAVADLGRTNQELDKYSQELQAANRQLRELDEIKSHFISAASHELKTPLTSIKGYVESLLEDEVGPLNETQREFLGYVKTSTDRLHRLLNELLDISKIESGQVQMNKDLTNLRDLLKEETMTFKAQAQAKNITLEVAADAHLREIYCDADKITEVMDNLISNAIKYTPAGGTVNINVSNLDDGIQFDVCDTGIGINKEDLTRIFEPFQHIEKYGLESNEDSTGLGLTLVKRIVEAHGGTIKVKSQEGNGSTFSVILPLGSRAENATSLPWAFVRH